jgi:hypothetical protein
MVYYLKFEFLKQMKVQYNYYFKLIFIMKAYYWILDYWNIEFFISFVIGNSITLENKKWILNLS